MGNSWIAVVWNHISIFRNDAKVYGSEMTRPSAQTANYAHM